MTNKKLARRRRRGAAAVEFALVAPVLLIVVFGIVEVGRMMMVQHSLTNAAREGARQAAMNGATTLSVENVVGAYMDDVSITMAPEDISVSPDPATAAGGSPITVTVLIDFDDVSWLPAPKFLEGLRLQAAATMRREIAQ